MVDGEKPTAKRRTWLLLSGAVLVACLALGMIFIPPWYFAADAGPIPRQPGKPDVPDFQTPQETVDLMLEMAAIKPGDIVYDLGCGDGRFAITAAERYGVRAVGVDILPEKVALAKVNAERAGVSDLVQIVEGDILDGFEFNEATVVTMFLLPHINDKLAPQLARLAPGSRIVSYAFGLSDYLPDRVEMVPSSIEGAGDELKVYLWTTPLRSVALPK